MTDYTAWLNTLPPGTSSTATGSRNDGLQFSVSSACTLTGIAFYVPSGETTLTGSSYTATLYSTTDGTTGTQIAQANGSGTFTAGAWNWIAFSQALSTGVAYVASVHSPNSIQFESSYWSTTIHGVTNGPLTIPTFNAAVGNAQQPLLTGATAFPSGHNSPGSWYGVDVKVTLDSITGAVKLKKMVASVAIINPTYTLFAGATHGLGIISDTAAYTLGNEFSVSAASKLLAVEFYSAATATLLPTTIAVFKVSDQSLVHSETPTWSGAAGSGYVRAYFTSPPSLAASTSYVVAVLCTGGSNWYSGKNGYWNSGGGGASGITNGILSAPNSAGSAHGQSPYHAGSTLTYPVTTTSGYDFSVDVLITPAPSDSGSIVVRLKKMVVSAASAEKATVTGAIKLKKMTVSASSSEKSVITSAIKLKKMIVAASSGVTTYRLMDGANGRPGVGSSTMTPPTSPTSYSGNFQAGCAFAVTDPGLWFEGYWWWVPTGGDTTAQKFCLYAPSGSHDNDNVPVLLPEATVISGTLTAGAWNFIALPEAIPLSIGRVTVTHGGGGAQYVATTAWTAVHGFPDTLNAFGFGDPYADGIVNGPLETIGRTGSATHQPSGVVNSSASCQTFDTSTNDPTTACPTNTDGSYDNFWLDVQVTRIPPATYAGSYRLYPNRYDSNDTTEPDATVDYVVATEVILSTTINARKIWYYSPAGTAQLATRASVWTITGVNSGTEVIAVTSPSWKAPDGSAMTAGTGWCYCDAGSVSLSPGHYKVSIFNNSGSPDAWSAKDANSNYWDTGEGARGVGFGPIMAPGLSSASPAYTYDASAFGATPPFSTGTIEPGQSTFAQAGANAYPALYVDGLAQNYWLDLEVSLPAPTITGAVELKKMKVSATSTEKSVVASTIKLKKMKVSATSTEKSVVASTIKLKKMKVAGTIGLSVFTLWSGSSHGLAVQTGDTAAYTLGTQFSVSENAELTAVMWYSASSVTILPTTIALFSVSGHTLIHSETPTWSGAAGSGYVRAAFSSPPALTAGVNYVVALQCNGGVFWYSEEEFYWTTGAGIAGITNGPLSAPSSAAAAAGQALFVTGSLAYPTSTSNGYDFGVDPEVTVGGSGPSTSGSGTIKRKKMKLAGNGGTGSVSVSTTSIAHVVQNVAVRRWFTASGGTAPYSWAVTSGSLPAGLSLASDGTLSGTPTATGTSSFTVGVTDASALTGSASFSIVSVSAPFSPGSPSTDGNGVVTWNITSAINMNDAETIRVLQPTSPSSAYTHAIAIAMPVNAGTDDTTFGNAIDTIRVAGLHNSLNLTIIEPSTGGNWMADNPSNGNLLQETYMLQVAAWAVSTYGNSGIKVFLIGFSRTGIAGQSLFFTRPDVYSGVASWDFPATMTDYDGTDPNHSVGGSPSSSYGTSDNFKANYQLSSANLAKWKAGTDVGSVNRIWIGGYHDFQTDVTPYDPILTTAGILHTTALVSASVHAWNPTPDWVTPALTALQGLDSGGAIIGVIKRKKMVLSGASHEKGIITGVIKLKKAHLAGGSQENITVTCAIKLKKMKVRGTNVIDLHRASQSFFVFSPL